MVSEERVKTNHMLLTELNMWDDFSIKSINDEWTLRYYNIIMNLLNSQVDEAVKWLDGDDAKELFFEEAEYQYELFQSLEEEWDTILEDKCLTVEELLEEVYNRGKAKGYEDMREHIRFTDTDKLALEFVTEYNFELIRKLDDDTRNQIKNLITSGVIAGDNPRKIAPKISNVLKTRLDGSTFTPTQRAVMIARTEISRVQNTGILQSYVNEGYTEVKILTAEDDNVCYTCLKTAYEFNEDTPIIYSNHGKEKIHNIIELIKGKDFPPFHPNCRCTYLSIWSTKGFVEDIYPEIIDLISYAPNKNNNQNFSQSAIQEFNELKEDPNIEWSIDEEINFNRQGLYNHEPFIKYYFKDSGVTIYKSLFNDVVSVKEIHEFFKALPNELTYVCNEIVLSHQMLEKDIGGEKKYVDGFTSTNSLNKIFILDKPNLFMDAVKITLTHELAHTIDGKSFKFSNNKIYETIYKKCKQRLLDKKIYSEKNVHISSYSRDFTNEALNGGKGSHRPYSEDFAECVVAYIHNPSSLFQLFPEKGEYINKILHKYTQEEVKKFKGVK